MRSGGRDARRPRENSWPRLLIDGESAGIGPDRIFVRGTPIGYVCAGIGAPTELLRFAFEGESAPAPEAKRESYESNPIFAACQRLDTTVVAGGAVRARRLGLEIPLDAIGERPLRRLAIAVALIKAGFDPNQPRDDHGRWTDEGAGAAGSSAAAAGDAGPMLPVAANVAAMTAGSMTADGAAAALGEAAGAGAGWSVWSGRALALLPRIAAFASGPLALAGSLVLIPSNRSGALESSGTLPDNPDISYFRSEGRLQLFQSGPDGERTDLYDGYPSADGFYHDADGHVVARDLGVDKGFVVDPTAISTLSPPTMDARAKERDPAEVEARNATLARAQAMVRAVDQTQVCPDPTFDIPNGPSMRSRRYQEQVTAVPWGVAFDIGGTKFDGCRYWGDGTMLEAKGEGFAWAMTPNGWRSWYKGGPKMEQQMATQSAKAWAVGKRVEWHIAEKSVADYLKVYAQRFPNVDVVWEPPLPRPANRKIFMVGPGEVRFARAGEFIRFDLLKRLSGFRESFFPITPQRAGAVPPTQGVSTNEL